MAIGFVLAHVFHKLLGHHHSEFVGALVVVAEGQAGRAFLLEADGDATLVADDAHLAVLHGSQRVGHDGEACDTRGTGADHVAVDKRHLVSLVVVLIVHVVDNLERIDVGLGEPAHHVLKLIHQHVVVEIFVLDGREVGAYLLAAHFVAAAVDGIEQALGEVGACAEELHLLADLHRAYAAGNAVVVAVVGTHEVVVLILDGRGLDRHLGAIFLPAFRQFLRPEHSEVGLGSRTEVVERVEEAERSLRHHRAAVNAHTADAFRHPHGVAGEEVVVLRRAEEAHDAQLDDELVDEFLCFFFGELAFFDVLFDEDVEEGADATDRHGCAVLVLHCAEVAEVNELHGLAGIACRAGHVESIVGAHLNETLQSCDLLGGFLALLDALFGHLLNVEAFEETLALFDEVVHAVEGDAAVVADDAAAAVGIGQTRDDVGVAGGANVLVVGREHAVVVRLAVFRVDFLRSGVKLVAVGFERAFHHADTAFGEDAALERRIGLQTHDYLVVLVDVACAVSVDRLRKFLFCVIYAFLAFHLEHFREFVPKSRCLCRGTCEE